MKLASVIASAALVGLVTVWDAPLKAVNSQLVRASAEEMKDATGLTAQKKIDMVIKNKASVWWRRSASSFLLWRPGTDRRSILWSGHGCQFIQQG